MEFLWGLWIPILISSVVLFFASFVAWMILPHHRSDWKKIPTEKELMQHLEDTNVSPGNYLLPYAANNKEMASQEYQQAYARGPRGVIHLYPMPNMALNLFFTLLFFLGTSTVIGYIAWEALEGWADKTQVDFFKVFQLTGAMGVLTYCSASLLNGIWFKRRLLTDFLDGLAYGIILASVFATCHSFGWSVVGGA